MNRESQWFTGLVCKDCLTLWGVCGCGVGVSGHVYKTVGVWVCLAARDPCGMSSSLVSLLLPLCIRVCLTLNLELTGLLRFLGSARCLSVSASLALVLKMYTAVLSLYMSLGDLNSRPQAYMPDTSQTESVVCLALALLIYL